MAAGQFVSVVVNAPEVGRRRMFYVVVESEPETAKQIAQSQAESLYIVADDDGEPSKVVGEAGEELISALRLKQGQAYCGGYIDPVTTLPG